MLNAFGGSIQCLLSGSCLIQSLLKTQDYNIHIKGCLPQPWVSAIVPPNIKETVIICSRCIERMVLVKQAPLSCKQCPNWRDKGSLWMCVCKLWTVYTILSILGSEWLLISLDHKNKLHISDPLMLNTITYLSWQNTYYCLCLVPWWTLMLLLSNVTGAWPVEVVWWY